MRVIPIGVGRTGQSIVDRMLEYESLTERPFVETSIVVGFSMASLMNAEHVPSEHRIVVGQEWRNRTETISIEDGAKITRDGLKSIDGMVDEADTRDADLFLVIAGTEDGLALGGAPVLANHLSQTSEKPVLGLAVAPFDLVSEPPDEPKPGPIETFASEADQLLLVDTHTLETESDATREADSWVPEEVAKRLGLLFAPPPMGEQETTKASETTTKVLDTVSNGDISSIGYAAEQIEKSLTLKLVAQLTGIDGSVIDANRFTEQLLQLVQQAGTESWACFKGGKGPQRALLVVAGPPSIPRMAVEQARSWIRAELSGVDVAIVTHAVPNSSVVACAVVSTGPHPEVALQNTKDLKLTDSQAEALVTEE